MRCSLIDSLTWVYPDSEIGSKPCLSQNIDVARGGTLAVTVLVKEARPGSAIRLGIHPKPGSRIEFFRLIDVPVEGNTGPVGFVERAEARNEFVARRAPFRVYDAMQPIGSAFMAKSATEVVRVHLLIDADCRRGQKEFVLSVRQGQETQALKVAVAIHGAVIPPVGRDSWPYTNWFSFANMATRHRLKPWSEGHWAMIRRYAQLMARNRQNMFWFKFEDVFAVGHGGLVLDRERLRRIVSTFTKAGLYYIEGGHFGRRSTSEWTCPTFSVSLTKRLATSAGVRLPNGPARLLASR